MGLATGGVDGKENGEGDDAAEYDDFDEGTQVAEEEVGVETAFRDEVWISSGEDGFEPGEEATGCRFHAFSIMALASVLCKQRCRAGDRSGTRHVRAS